MTTNINLGSVRKWRTVAIIMMLFSGMLWAQIEETKLTLPDAEADELFGSAVDIYGDTAIVGTPLDGTSNGSLAIFRNSPNGWIIDQKLVTSDTEPVDLLGQSVAIYGDVAAVGAIGDDDVGLNAGAVYVFRHVDTQWEEVAKITASDGQAGDNFGRSVALYADRLVVGAPGAASDTGAVYYFISGNDDEWAEINKFSPSDGSQDDEFGWDVDIWDHHILVGSPNHDAYGSNAGAVYIYEEIETLELMGWWLQDKVGASNAAASDNYGYSVSIYGDNALVGAPNANSSGYPNAGSAYILERDNDDWNEAYLLTDTDKTIGEQYGYSVSLSDTSAIIGIPSDGQIGSYSGAAVIYRLNENGWTEPAKIKASDGADSDQFGWSVAIDGEASIIGAPGNDDDGNNSGSAYLTNGISHPPLLMTIITPSGYTSREGCVDFATENTTADSVYANIVLELQAPGGYLDTLLVWNNIGFAPFEKDTIESCWHLPWNVPEGLLTFTATAEGIKPIFDLTTYADEVMEFLSITTARFILPDNLCTPAPIIYFEVENTTEEASPQMLVHFFVTYPNEEFETPFGTHELNPLLESEVVRWPLPLFLLAAPVQGTYTLRASGGQEECEIETDFVVPPCPSGIGIGFGKEGSEPEKAPATFSLKSNYPNPFNPTTNIQFGLPLTSQVELTVYDILGREVVTLANTIKDAGIFEIIWDGKDSSGNRVASGTYLYKIEATPLVGTETQPYIEVKKMLLLN